jgi:LmbE family N-acetylglucosaminyl deacetylase
MKAFASLALASLLAIPALAGGVEQKSILVVFAHPDDETLVGPLLSAYARKGVRVRLVIATDGARGVSSHAGIAAGPDLAIVRAQEAQCSSRALGIEAPILLGFEDGELGRFSLPPWEHLGRLERELRELLAAFRPDVIITFGPEGAYGHPDHRLVGAVVTQLVQASVEGAPAALLFPGLPKDRLPKEGAGGPISWSPTDRRFLTVRVPYDEKDLSATRAALACHKSQFPDDQVEPATRWMHEALGGHVYLRPWFGEVADDDIFGLVIP